MNSAMSVGDVRVSTDWLDLREPADAAARSVELVGLLQQHLPTDSPVTIHDLGCGTGSMLRWLAPQLHTAQHWVMYDRDGDLLDDVRRRGAVLSANGSAVTIETRRRDITRLEPSDLDPATLVTASALLDMFTLEELDRFVGACAPAACPVLVTLSVVGSVEFTPTDPRDEAFGEAFNAHQRRAVGDRKLLGPDALAVAATAFGALGAAVTGRSSPWRLGPDDAPLIAAWLDGWVGAAVEQNPALASGARDYVRMRLAQSEAGDLSVRVKHQDILVVPR